MSLSVAQLAQAKKLAGFAMLPAIGFLSSLVVLPVISARFGSTGWPSVALGMSIGSGAGILSELGWGVSGPMRVARAAPSAAAQLYMTSLVTQAMVALPMSIVAAAIAAVIAPAYVATSAMMAFASCWAALSPAWFFVGTGQPRNIMLTDTIPRVVLSFATAGAMWLLRGPLWLYPAGQLVAVVFGLMLGKRLTGGRLRQVRRFGARRLRRIMRFQITELQGNVASSMYIALPTAIVGVVSPASLGVFSAANRLQRMLLRLLNSLPNAFQNWVGSGGTPDLRRARAMRAVKINAAVGALCGAGFAVAAPLVSEILFAGEFTVGYELAALCGVVIFSTQTSRASGRVALVAFRRVDILRTSAVVGGCLGLVAVVVGAHFAGAAGAMAAEGLAEISVLTIQLRGLRRIQSERKRKATSTYGLSADGRLDGDFGTDL